MANLAACEAREEQLKASQDKMRGSHEAALAAVNGKLNEVLVCLADVRFCSCLPQLKAQVEAMSSRERDRSASVSETNSKLSEAQSELASRSIDVATLKAKLAELESKHNTTLSEVGLLPSLTLRSIRY